ncbi:pilus assembly protein CpaD [Aurantiacibacter xanthus]|uniref:Pilus assembly protein CpaD n=1 Tax=Aurantiacibacter xanthus TaxID=1784712 RepID=A0A3A1P2B5_9SPHN|nr:CpaD family pilus assembly protein [Aurantiacibacter xanthus]RIV83220.1 pilus assembly protein CpaD [Aurantiacibacter xanthus]
MTNSRNRAATPVLALSLALGLAACANTNPAHNSTLNSVHQPVVERNTYTLDLATNAGGLPISEQQRLANWFEAMDIGYGDRIAIDAAVDNPSVRENVAAIASRHSLLLSDGAPVTEGFVDPGKVRVVVTRSRAYVPNCPDWSASEGTTLGNNTSPNFGCAVNSNLAAMIADPEHLLEGARGTGETTVMTSTRAIQTYREIRPSAAQGVTANASTGN